MEIVQEGTMPENRVRNIPDLLDWLDKHRDKAVANLDYRTAALLRELAAGLRVANDCEPEEAKQRIRGMAHITRAISLVLLRLMDELEEQETAV